MASGAPSACHNAAPAEPAAHPPHENGTGELHDKGAARIQARQAGRWNRLGHKVGRCRSRLRRQPEHAWCVRSRLAGAPLLPVKQLRR